MSTVAINQSNYIPWKGYFDLIHDADVFVFYDDVQYTTRDWRNRNLVKTSQGAKWLTIPVGADRNRLIRDVVIEDNAWQAAHWKTLRQCYASAPHFADYEDFFEDVYLGRRWHRLSEINQYLIERIAKDFLGITTRFADSSPLALTSRKSDRILNILEAYGARRYVSGPKARDYLAQEGFLAGGIELVWKDYSGYPQYRQFFPPFDHAVTILDLLFHVGSNAPAFIWAHRD